MEGNCRVSVLVPVCNVERYLRQCMRSLVSQTLDDLQIICLDDGSTDSSLSILREFEKIDARIEVVTKPNSGYGSTMNLGLERARGEYIGIVESDDFAEPDMFEKLYECAKTHEADVVKGDFFEHHTDSDPKKDGLVENLGFCAYGKVFSPLDEQNVFLVRPAIWSGLYRASFLRDNGIRFLETPGASFQDTSFNFKVFAAAERAFLMKEAYLHYRVDNAGSSVKSQKKVFCVCDEYAEIWDFVSSRPEVKERLGKRIPQIQFGGYKWNLDRLTPGLQYRFYERFVREFAEINQKGLLDRSYFDEIAWSQLQSMLSDPDAFFRRHYGPLSVERTRIVCFAEGDASDVSAALGEIEKRSGDCDETICVSLAADERHEAEFAKWASEVGCVYCDDDLFLSRLIGLIDPTIIRGKTLDVIFVGKGGVDDSALDEFDEAAGRSAAVSLSVGAESIAYSYDFPALDSLGVPLAIPLLLGDYYRRRLGVGGEQLAEVKLEGFGFGSERTLCEYEEAVRALEAFALPGDVVVEAPYEQAKTAYFRVATLWSWVRAAYYELPYEARLRIGEPPSSIAFPALRFCPEGACAPMGDAGNPRVSVIVPVHNGQKYVRECLDSVLSQDIEPLQVICINDGSTDASLDILEEAARLDSRVTVVSQFNGGAGAARNRGIDFASGDYLAFIDSDDYYPSEHALSHLVEAAERSGALVCGGSFCTVDHEGVAKTRFSGEDVFYTFDCEGFRHWADDANDYGWIRFVYRRSLFEDESVRFPNLLWYEDPVFLARVMSAAKGVYYALPEITYCYREEHKDMVWTAPKVRDLLHGIALNIEYASRLESDGLYSRLVFRIHEDYRWAITANIDDEEVFARLVRLQGGIDFGRVSFVRERGLAGYLLAPLSDARTGNFDDTTVVRLAKRFENSSLYQSLRAVRKKVGGGRSS